MGKQKSMAHTGISKIFFLYKFNKINSRRADIISLNQVKNRAILYLFDILIGVGFMQ